MRARRHILHIALIGVVVLVAALVTTVPSSAHAEQKNGEPVYKSLNELAEKRLGMISGSLYGEALIKKAPEISLDDIETYDDMGDMVAALKNDEIDAFLAGEAPAKAVVGDNSDFALVEDPVTDDNIGMCLQKNSKLTERFNQRLDLLRMDGVMDALRNRDPKSFDAFKPEQNDASGAKANGMLRVAYSEVRPMSYTNAKGDTVGYEVELIRRIASDLGFSVTFYSMPFNEVLSSVEAGQADVGIGNITITEQRSQHVDFTTPDFAGSVVVVTHAKTDRTPPSFIAGVVRSFKRTFLDESRWQVIASGIMVTAIISLCAGVLGTPLAIALVWRRYCGGRLTARLISVFVGLMGGVPIVVVLMVLYYVLFASAHVPGEVVAVIAFVLSFAGRASALLWAAVEDVPERQAESGLSLGYTQGQAFFKIVLPQAFRAAVLRLVKLYVNLVKETAVVGYIAVQDLTHASSFIRARTMDALFPLVATAIIYFLICSALTWILKEVAVRCFSKDRPRIARGVAR